MLDNIYIRNKRLAIRRGFKFIRTVKDLGTSLGIVGVSLSSWAAYRAATRSLLGWSREKGWVGRLELAGRWKRLGGFGFRWAGLVSC